MVPIPRDQIASDLMFYLSCQRILTDAAIYYHRTLMRSSKNSAIWKYLEDRDIHENTVERFLLGYSDGNLCAHLEEKGYDVSIIVSKRIGWWTEYDIKDFFGTDRLIMPILEKHTVKNLSSRLIYSDSNGIRPKYKHLAGNKYNFYDKSSIKKDELLFICEGQIDRLTLEQAGLNSVSFLGTSGLPKDEESIDLLNTKPSSIICLPDIEHNPISWAANMKTYVKLQSMLGNKEVRIGHLAKRDSLKQGEKIDPNSLFYDWSATKIQKYMRNVVRNSIPVYNLPEWESYYSSKNSKEKKQDYIKKTKLLVDNIMSVPIVEVMEKVLGVDLLSVGQEYVARCINPEHEDNRPSMRIYPNTNTFYCWACKEWGDAIGAVALAKKIGWEEATKILKEEFNVPNTN